ncbi:MAG: TIGR00282 family metallophosphoesterase [Candidatus Omnitrophota bacterium]
MKLLFIGDIVGKPGREAIKALVPDLVEKNGIDFVVANAENAAGGSGLTPSIADELFDYGIGVLTNGDHVWKRREIIDALEADQRVLRPLNYPKEVPGRGSCVIKLQTGVKIGIISLVGRVFMQPVECPFRTAREEVEKIKQSTPNIFIDIHAEATSEKIALGWYLDGQVTAVMGTHTHVQTADERVLPQGSAYITDVGMTGPFDSVIGRKKEQILTRFLTQMPTRFQMAEDDVRLNGAIVDFDEKIGKANSIKRIAKQLN